MVLRRHGAHAPPAAVLRTKKAVVTLVATAFLIVGASATMAIPSPPTNGGNGAGQSGQCTGPQDDRPASCKSQGGPGNQP